MTQPPAGEPPQYGPPQYGPPQPGPPQPGPPQPGPPQPGPQQFGPPQFGSPAMGPVTTQFAKVDPGPSRSFGVISAAVTGVGAVLVVLAFTAFDWFSNGPSNSLLQGAAGASTFRKIHTGLDDLKRQLALVPGGFDKMIHYGVAPAYFSWLGWTLLVAGVVFALVGASPLSGFSEAGRVLGLLAGIAGVGASFGAIYIARLDPSLANTLHIPQPGYLDYLKHVSVGFFLAVGGFALIAIGAAMGPNRAGS